MKRFPADAGPCPRHRSGSALLIVLGMLAFMVISGVAFSLYMRSSRMTSSFTRRASASRQLAKAALAEAIDQIDRSIGNDPHPNVRHGSGNKYNYWLGRVFLTPYDNNGTLVWAGNAQSKIIALDGKVSGASSDLPSTVPVLTLESLAYIPPSLVNEARYYGQKTPTACWQTLDFDAGRYAYVALDVSDYFDVNRAIANEARLSNPQSRVTLSYMFENDSHDQWSGGADTWDGDSFMGQFRDINDDGFSFKTVPLTSVADFNLFWGDRTIGQMKNPFVQYLLNSGNGGFYNATPGDGTFEKYGEMTFVADSLDAPVPESEKKTASGKQVLNLDGASNPYDDDTNQPFPNGYLETSQENRTVTKVAMTYNGRRGGKQLTDAGVPMVSMFHLSDYLDPDRIPISLGLPSVERVPMICGIKPNVSSPVSIGLVMVPDTDVDVSGTRGQTDMVVKRKIHWRIDPASLTAFLGGVSVLVAHPFRPLDAGGAVPESGYFTLDGKVQIFLSMKTNPMRLRVGNPVNCLHWGNGNPGTAGSPGSAVFANSVLNLPLQDAPIPAVKVSKPEDCVQQIALTVDLTSAATMMGTALSGGAGDILTVTYQWTQHMTPSATPGGTPTYDNLFTGQIPDMTVANANMSVLTGSGDAPGASWLPLGAQGATDSSFLTAITTATAGNNIDFILNVVPTVRIKSTQSAVLGKANSPKTVDMVPACLDDDIVLNGIQQNDGFLYNDFNNSLSTPLMLFKADFSVNPQSTVSGAASLTLSPSGGVMVDDPRYNHAPENWKDLSTFTPAGWYAVAKNSFAQTSGTKYERDGDIFMATSDQGYLQSVYELAFLPQLANLKSGAGTTSTGFLGNYWGINCDQLCPANRTDYPISDAAVMWKTYDPFGRMASSDDDFEGIGLENLGRGLRVNPYSDVTNVIMAAFANTPRDWRTASEDPNRNPAANKDADDFNDAYAWNEYSSGDRISWQALSSVAGDFMTGVRRRAAANNGDWRDALDDLFDQEAVCDTSEYLCGLNLKDADLKPKSGENAPLYSVDKKFLYGYWRNCFAARQQLFLVFFRAEPSMMGGGVAGVTPPQLGARGVALVWRNPNNPKNSSVGTKGYSGNASDPFALNTSYIPHQTRVLFYKQFE